MTRQLKFTCLPADKGGTQCEAIGFEGKGCTQTIGSFVEGMGSEINGVPDLKDEFHMEDTAKETETDGS